MSSDLFSVDPMQLYFGYDYYINDDIIIHQPTLREICERGEQEYYSTVYTLTAIPSDMKSQLWDMGIDWEEMQDFDLFLMLASTLSAERTKILLGDLDLSHMGIFRNQENDEIFLMDRDTGVKIDKLIYMRMVNYIRKMHNIKPKIERAKNARTKQVLIDVDRQKLLESKNQEYKSFLLPLLSAVKVKMKYTKEYLLDMGIVEFMDDLQRLQIVDQADHLLNGCYSGMIDTSKINKKELNWMRDLT